MSPPTTARGWNEHYRDGHAPWDCGLVSREMLEVLAEQKLSRGRVLELGCGTGTNAVGLAQRGFTVVGVDCAPLALEEARRKSEEATASVEFYEADVCTCGSLGESFNLVFDRGCYHCVRKINLPGYLRTIQLNSHDNCLILILAGNADDPHPGGPPKVTEQQIREELGVLGRFVHLRRFHFTDAGGVQGPLGWSCLIQRKT